MGVTHRHLLPFLFLSISGYSQAAPMLRLTNSVVGPVSTAVGASPSAQVVEAYNAGNGVLSLTATPAASATWLSATVGAPRACTTSPAPAASCIPLTFSMNTASLAAGSYTGSVTISDANNAVDSPQVITVTVQVGGGVPNSVGQTQPIYVAPGTTTSVPFSTNSLISGHPTTQDGANWLSLALDGTGSFRFVLPYRINLSPPSSMASGTYNGTLVTTGSTLAAENKSIPVTMHVTTQPIAVPSASPINVVVLQGGPVTTYPFIPALSLSNSGQGTLTVQGYSATGTGVSVQDFSDLGIISVDPTGLSPGSYTGTIVAACSAVNCPLTVPLNFTVVAPAAPSINYQGAVNNATQVPGDAVCPGDWIALLGQQLSLSAFTPATTVPLPTTLGGATVLVNGEAAPIYYTSFGQIAFQMPSDTALGTATVQIQRDGQSGNTVSIPVVERAPRIVVVTDDCSKGCNLRNAGVASSIGDTIVLWAYGLGPTTPSVVAGAVPPADPPIVTPMPLVNFGGGIGGMSVPPIFAGMTGIGLYQINVTIPLGAPKGVVTISLVFPDSTVSNPVQILIQ